jgi:hypothetical protein
MGLDDSERDAALPAEVKALAATLVTPEAAQGLKQLPPESRENVLDVMSRIIEKVPKRSL